MESVNVPEKSSKKHNLEADEDSTASAPKKHSVECDKETSLTQPVILLGITGEYTPDEAAEVLVVRTETLVGAFKNVPGLEKTKFFEAFESCRRLTETKGMLFLVSVMSADETDYSFALDMLFLLSSVHDHFKNKNNAVFEADATFLNLGANAEELHNTLFKTLLDSASTLFVEPQKIPECAVTGTWIHYL